jgi:hypothetical protein
MVFIHTRRIIIVPGHQHLLGFLAPLFESHRHLVLLWLGQWETSRQASFRIWQVATF